MKRLSEEILPADSPGSKLADLVRGAQPFRANPFRKRMILQRLTRASVAPRAWLPKPVLASVVAAVVGSAGIAGASYGWYKSRVAAQRIEARASEPVRTASAPRKALPAPVVAPPRVETIEPESSAKPLETSPNRRLERPLTARQRVSKENGEDPSEVLEAIRALRKQGDAARAQVLLDQYLKTHPSGALTEDALVLSIEAALARHDPRASEYAKRYLNRFPNGRFRSLAQRVLTTQP
jgi:hypothetical protein